LTLVAQRAAVYGFKRAVLTDLFPDKNQIEKLRDYCQKNLEENPLSHFYEPDLSFRSHLADVLDQVNDDHMPIIVTRRNGKSALLMSMEDFKAYEETAYLMASPENARRLTAFILEVKSGKIKSQTLLDKE
jgi:antitoxin YefM